MATGAVDSILIRPPMPLPLRLARLNRRLTNPVLWPIVARLPGLGFGRIVHVGRRSGRRYRTPMLAFRRGQRVVFALTYGRRTEWLQNVLAAGSCDFETRHGTLHLVEPRPFRDPDRRPVPAVVRPVLGWIHAADFLEMRVAADARSGEPGAVRGRG